MVAIDVTDATFETEVMERSDRQPVVVDLWAPWCGPCKQLGPIIERAVDATAGAVALVKINVDDNRQSAEMFQVQGIPAVYAIAERKVVNGFVGAQGEDAVSTFVQGLLPDEGDDAVAALVSAGDEASLRQAVELAPDDANAIVALAELLAGSERGEEALTLLARIPETAETRRVAALARMGGSPGADEAEDVEATLAGLLPQVKVDQDARQKFVDLLELLGPDDPRTGEWRKKLTTQLF